MTHHLTDKYEDFINSNGQKDSRNTGVRVLEGYNKKYQVVDTAVRLERSKDNKITGKIVECGNAISLVGMPVAANWDSVMSMIEASLGGRVRFDHRKEVSAAK